MAKLYLKFKKLVEENLKYLISSVLLAVPLYPKFPLFFLPGVSVSVRIEDFLILSVVLLFLSANITQIFKIIKNRFISLLLISLFIALASSVFGSYLSQTTTLNVSLLHFFRRVEYLSLFVVSLFSIKKREDALLLIKVLMLTIFYAFIYGMGQKYLDLPIITTQNSEYSKGAALRYMPGGHLVSTFAGHYDLASYILLVSPILCLALFSFKNKIAKSITFLSLIAGLWLIVYTASRISMVSYVGGMLLALLAIRKYKFIPVFLIIVVFFVNMSTNLISRYTNIFEVVYEKISYDLAPEVLAIESTPRPTATPAPITPFEDRSTSIRLNVEWPRAYRAIMKNPIYGTGYSSLTLATDNDYLRMLGETGIYGFFTFYLFLFTVLWNIFKKALKVTWSTPEGVILIGMLAAIPGVFLNMVFIDILEASKFAIVFWILIGSSLGIALHTNEK